MALQGLQFRGLALAPHLSDRRLALRLGQHDDPAAPGPFVELLAQLVGDLGRRARQQEEVDRACRAVEAHEAHVLLEVDLELGVAALPDERDDVARTS